MKSCEECSRLCDKPLPPQSGCNDCYDLLRDNYKKLQADNAKLRLVVDHYAQADDVGAYARMILRELGDKL